MFFAKLKTWIVIAAFGITIVGCSTARYNTPAKIVNFERVHKNLYRSGQFTDTNQWSYAAGLGIKVSIKLNTAKEGSDNVATNYGIRIIEVPMPPSGICDWYKEPDPVDYFYALIQIKVALDKGEGVLIHCTHGEDRTGLMVGGVQVLLFDWNKDVAWKDMKRHHYHKIFIGLDRFWYKYVKYPK